MVQETMKKKDIHHNACLFAMACVVRQSGQAHGAGARDQLNELRADLCAL